jgi:hypothetical protein
MKKTYLFIFSLLVSNIINSQINNVKLIDKEDNSPVQYATILNKSNSNFTFSDENGNFEISVKYADTLLVTHTSYSAIDFNVNDIKSNHIYLSKKINSLNEVFVSKKSQKILDSEKNNDKTYYGLSLDREYALFVENIHNTSEKFYFQKLIIPVEYKKKYSSDGLLSVSIIEADENNNISNNIIVEPAYTDTNKAKNNKLEIVFPKKVFLPKNNYYVVLRRILVNQQFNKKDNNLSVNPFIYSRKSNLEKFLYIKSIFNDKWVEVNKDNYPYTPVFNYELIVLK